MTFESGRVDASSTRSPTVALPSSSWARYRWWLRTYIVNWIKTNKFDGYAPSEDAAICDKVAELWIEAQVCRLMTMRSMSIVENGGNFTYEGSAEKT